MKTHLIAGSILLAASTASFADSVGMTGLGQPFDNMQPSLAITQAIALQGIYPSRDSGTAYGDTLGFIYQFAGNFAPTGSASAQGQLFSISQNTALFSLMGTTYGGNGISNFALPNLVGTAVIGTGTGPGLSPQILGATTGANSTTLSVANLPAHDHTLSGGGVTGDTGGGQAFNNMQLSLPLHTLIAANGVFPSPNGGGGSAAFLGQVATFAGAFTPGGWLEANGQLLSINQNQALFSILGTTYGGDGISNFALPNLSGRVAVGADATHPFGSSFGTETNTLSLAQLPAHSHTEPGGGVTGTTGGSQPVNNDQPSLALNYLIALQGVYPGSFNMDLPVIGQITEFAGGYVPSGWALANGQLLPIAQNQALFSLLGTTYGGDGRTTFALPDFRGRTAIGTGNGFDLGGVYGSDVTTLTVNNLPAHDHTIPGGGGSVPEPGTLLLLGAGLAALSRARRKRT